MTPEEIAQAEEVINATLKGEILNPLEPVFPVSKVDAETTPR